MSRLLPESPNRPDRVFRRSSASPGGVPTQRAGGGEQVLVGDAGEAVSPNPAADRKFVGNRVQGGAVRESDVEGGVEHRDHRNRPSGRRAGGPYPGDARGVVERGQLFEGGKRFRDRL